jgi:hypothetical protein
MAVSNTVKLVLILLVAVGAVWLICSSNNKEGFVDVKQNFYLRDAQLMNRPTYRPNLPPRFYGGDYTGELRGAQPPLNVQAVPGDPLEFERMKVKGGDVMVEGYSPLRENYGPPNQAQQYVEGGIPTLHGRAPVDPVEFTRMVGFDQSKGVPKELQGYSKAELDRMINDKYINPLTYTDPSEILPGEDMSGTQYGRLASDPHTYVYDRLIYANQRRFLNGLGDRIRGDLRIVPDNRGWFQVSVRPHLDLTRGSMDFIGPSYETIINREDVAMSRSTAENALKIRRFM